MNPDFLEFPKIGRLVREAIITEKIDGTNAQIYIVPTLGGPDADAIAYQTPDTDGGVGHLMFAGSRTRYITPGRDNFGFAAWVKAHADELWGLGPGRHYGEWWGCGIQRGYGLSDKRFSLFNTLRWTLHGTTPQRIPKEDPRVEVYQDVLPPCVGLVPVLYRGLFVTEKVDEALARLARDGSLAAPGFTDPEGIVVYHTASGAMFKRTVKHDEQPKSRVRA